MPDTQLPDSYPLEFQELYAKTYNNKPQIQSVLKPFMNFISKCRKRLTLFFHSLSLRVVLPYGWPSPPVNGSRSHRTHSLNKKKRGGAWREVVIHLCQQQSEKHQDPAQVPLAFKAIWSPCPWRNQIRPFISSLLATLLCRCLPEC